eukprot:c17602_g1_i4.p1 GENE.c17602_g1_i4~~c17602_g1_i4.p1  ORF type:complete len:265 (+),score=54.34 c17602_g1_i4:333-1127(+)
MHSVSLSSDRETFLSASERYIHLWNLERSDISLKLVDPEPDLSPLNPMDPMKLLTAARFHPQLAHVFAYSDGAGHTYLADQRQSSSLEDTSTRLKDMATLTPLQMRAISDFAFSSDGRMLVTRDVLCLRLWDLAQPSRPVETLWLNRDLKAALLPQFSMYPLAYSFRCNFSNDDRLICTGNFNNTVFIYDRRNTMSTHLPVTAQAPQKKSVLQSLRLKVNNVQVSGRRRVPVDPVLCQAYHPHLNLMVCPIRDRISTYVGTIEK